MKSVNKGYPHYRKQFKIKRFLWACLFLAAIIIQFVLSKTLQSDQIRILFTVMSILTVLPFANICSPLLATILIKSPNENQYNEVKQYENKGYILYDLILTMKEQIMPADYIIITSDMVYVYLSSSKPDKSLTSRFIKDNLSKQGIDLQVVVYNSYTDFINKLSNLPVDKDIEKKRENIAQIIKTLSM